jgi:hypothetical protein
MDFLKEQAKEQADKLTKQAAEAAASAVQGAVNGAPESHSVVTKIGESSTDATVAANTKTEGQTGGKKMKKVAALLKNAAKNLPLLSKIEGGALKQKVKSAKRKLLKASNKARQASKKMLKKGGSKKASKKSSKKSSSRKSSKKSSRK